MVLSLFLASSAQGNGLSIHGNVGYATSNFTGNSTNVWINPYMQNQYTQTNTSQAGSLYGLGIGYDWNLNPVTFNLGVSTYFLKTTVAGINQPFINEPGLNAPGLYYQAYGQSLSFFLEPKLIFNKPIWQPFIFGGAGLSINQLSNYAERPITNGAGAAPTLRPFANQRSNEFAYEGGLGLQYPLSAISNALILSLDYRYINWGNASLGNATTNNALSFSNLYSGIATLMMSWHF